MSPSISTRQLHSRTSSPTLFTLLLATVVLGACASSSSVATPTRSLLPYGGMPAAAMRVPTPDPRVGLRAGGSDAAQALWNIRLISNTPKGAKFNNTNSDLAFSRNFVIQGNYNGYQVFDISNAAQPTLRTEYFCPASQSDVSVYRNLLFVSGEGGSGRLDCGAQGVRDTVSMERLRGIRIFDMTDIANPKYIGNVQTCRGSHTHTVVEDPNDKANVYIYISGSSSVRSPSELPGCLDGGIDDPNSARFRIEVIRVPLAAPQNAAIVSSPRIFNDLAAPPQHAPPAADTVGRGARLAAQAAARAGGPPAGGRAGGRAGGGGGPRGGPNQCHDITVYPAVGLAGGACGGYGLLLDISDAANPRRIDAVADSNFSFWHSATFSNDGAKVLFTDEWGGGSAPRCRSTDKYEWGANALFSIDNGKMNFHSYYKMPAAQTSFENCVAHNGSLIPVPGREIMVQGWYQGGISVFDWTDVKHPFEMAFFDRGPMDSTRLVSAGSWSVYWYNGKLVSSEIARGLDIFELTPSPMLSQNEIDAARTVVFTELNAQGQPKLVWPASFAMPRAYIDQLERSNGLSAADIASARAALTAAEQQTGSARRDALSSLASTLNGHVSDSSDREKAIMLAHAVRDLAAATR